MDIIKLLEDSDSLIVAPELNERLQEKVQNIFIMLAQSLDQRKTSENTVKCQAKFVYFEVLLANVHITLSYK